MKPLLSAALLAFIAAALITFLRPPEPLEQRLLHLQLEQAMPEYSDELSAEPAELQALFLSYAEDPVLLTKARLAFLRYPEMARPIFLTYGDSEIFRNVLRDYGEDIVLPVHYFLNNEVSTVEWMRRLQETAQSASNAVRRLWSDEPSEESQALHPMSDEERGLYALHFLKEEGYDFLGQFVMTPEGQVAWVQTERVLEGLNSFFAGGIRGLETKWRQDIAIGATDIGWAAVDVAVGIAAFKILRAGRAAAVGGQTLTFSQRSAALGAGLWRGSVVGARLVKYGAPAVLAYVAIRHPSVINSLLGSAAEKLGLPVALVQVLGWTLVLLPVVLLLRLLATPLAWLLSGLSALLRWGSTMRLGKSL